MAPDPTSDHDDDARAAGSSVEPMVGVFVGQGEDVLDGDDAFCRIIGRTRAEFVESRRTLESISPPEWSDADRAALDEARRTGGFTTPYRKEYLRPDRSRVPVLVVFSTIDHDTDRWLGYVVDLSSHGARERLRPPDRLTDPQPLDFYERLLAELVRERGRLVSMLDGTTLLIWSVDPSIRLIAANAAFHRTALRNHGRQLRPGEVLVAKELIGHADPRWSEWYERALRGEHVVAVVGGPDDRIHALTVSPLTDHDGSVTGVIVVAEDVTEEHRAAEEMTRNATLTRVAAQLGGVSGWHISADGPTVQLSQELVDLLGLSSGGPFHFDDAVAWYPAAMRGPVTSAVRRCLDDGTGFDLEIRVGREDLDASGIGPELDEDLWVRVIGEAVREGQAITGVDGAIVDITRYKSLELRHRELADVVRRSNEGIIVRDFDGRVTAWNDAAARIYGWTAEEAIGRHITELVDAGAIDAFHEMNEALLRDGEWTGRMTNVDRHGRRFPVDLHVDLIRDETGRPVQIFSIASDATERESLERQVADAQRLESVGQLTAGIAHDFNNLLTIIMGSVEQLADTDDPEQSELATMALDAAERGARLTAQLLAFARRQTLRPSALDTPTAVRDLAELLRRSLPEHIELVVDAPDDVGSVWVDRQQFDSALMNLAINARDAMPGGGRLEITLRRRSVGAGAVVELSVSDSGHGMSEEVRTRAFDPFFTTKGLATNSGLGLSMVHGFVIQSGGSIELRSGGDGRDGDRGTTVVVELPAVDPIPSIDASGPTELEHPLTGHERILVVEDEPLVARHASSVLRTLGYVVRIAVDGPSALESLDRDGPVELVFTDLVMPGGIDGRQLARRVVDRWPDTRVLYTTGHPEVSHIPGAPDASILPKPYRRAWLAAAVRDALDAPAPS